MSNCAAGHQRHWFTAYGYVGTSSPVCVRQGCNAQNPKFKFPDEREDYQPADFKRSIDETTPGYFDNYPAPTEDLA